MGAGVSSETNKDALYETDQIYNNLNKSMAVKLDQIAYQLITSISIDDLTKYKKDPMSFCDKLNIISS